MKFRPSIIACAIAAVLGGPIVYTGFADPATKPTTSPTTSPTTAPAANATDRITAPTLITLKMDNAKVEDVMAAISKATGYKFGFLNQGMGRLGANANSGIILSVNYDKTPFWTVISDFCQKAQVAPYFGGGIQNGKFLFLPAGQMGDPVLNCPSANIGAALILVTQASRQNTVTFGEPATIRNDFSLQMMMLCEPKMHVISYDAQPQIDDAVDDKGNSLVPKGLRDTSRTDMGNRQIQANLSLNLAYPAKNPGTKIARLSGKLKMTTAMHSESIEFTEIMGDKEQVKKSASGRRLTLVSVKPMDRGGDPRQYIVKIILYRDSMDPQKFNELMNNLDLRVIDARGRELQYQGNREASNNGSEAHLSMMYHRPSANEGMEDVSEPIKIAWDMTTDAKDITLPFEFKDLPMP